MTAVWTKIDPPEWHETPRGGAWAKWMIDYGMENSLYWLMLNEAGQYWRLPNEQIRACKNYTMERPNPEKPV